MTTSDPAARRVHAHFTVKELALAVGDDQGRTFHSRIVRRVLSQLTPAELALDDIRLAEIVRERAVALATLSLSSLSSSAAQAELEGGDHGRTLDGWEHPELMPADDIVQSLRFKSGRMYLPATVEAARKRLAKITTLISEPSGYVSVTATALRRGAIRPWYSKTDFLLDLLHGKIKAYSLTPDPRLCDLHVDHQAVRDMSGARNPALIPGSPGFAQMKRINDLLRHRHGADAGLSLDQFRRIARWSLIPHEVKRKSIPSKDRDVSERFFFTEGVADLVARHRQSAVLSIYEAAIFAPTEDIAALAVELSASGLSGRAVAAELSRQGVFTPAGFDWHQSVLHGLLVNAQATGAPIFGIRVPSC